MREIAITVVRREKIEYSAGNNFPSITEHLSFQILVGHFTNLAGH